MTEIDVTIKITAGSDFQSELINKFIDIMLDCLKMRYEISHKKNKIEYKKTINKIN